MKGRIFAPENRKWWTLGAVAFGLFMIMLDNTVVFVALASIQSDLGISTSELQWVVNGYALTFAVLMLTGGKLADLLGRRFIFIVGLVIFTAASLACGLATGAAFLIGARIVQGVGSALMQLGRLSALKMYGTCSSRTASAVSDLGGIPIDYQHQDFVKEIHRLTTRGVDVVFDGIGGTHIWRSRKALRAGGTVVAYGLTSSLRMGRLASGRSGGRHRFRAIAIFGLYIAGGWLLPGRKRVVPYSIQWFKRLRPALFRQDLIALFDLLRQRKIRPLIAERFPLAEARRAHELLGKGGVIGKIVLVPSAWA